MFLQLLGAPQQGALPLDPRCTPKLDTLAPHKPFTPVLSVVYHVDVERLSPLSRSVVTDSLAWRCAIVGPRINTNLFYRYSLVGATLRGVLWLSDMDFCPCSFPHNVMLSSASHRRSIL